MKKQKSEFRSQEQIPDPYVESRKLRILAPDFWLLNSDV